MDPEQQKRLKARQNRYEAPVSDFEALSVNKPSLRIRETAATPRKQTRFENEDSTAQSTSEDPSATPAKQHRSRKSSESTAQPTGEKRKTHKEKRDDTTTIEVKMNGKVEVKMEGQASIILEGKFAVKMEGKMEK